MDVSCDLAIDSGYFDLFEKSIKTGDSSKHSKAPPDPQVSWFIIICISTKFSQSIGR